MSMEAALRTLMEGLIDYAGLYPPASLGMEETVRNYAAYRAGPHAAWLGRFVLPAARLEEFARARSGAGSAAESAGAWPLAALLGPDSVAELDPIIAFNAAAHGTAAPAAIIDTLEMKPETPADIRRMEALIPAGVTAYFELPLREPGPFLAALAEGGGRAKLRTGGVTPDRIPAAADVARFLAACARAKVPFKATAGLHHPLRSLRNLTYAPDSPQAVMHGFLNVFLAAAFAAQGMDVAGLAALLGEESPAAFAFTAREIRWREHRLNADRLREARRGFAIAFGSCSFEEPRQDLAEAGWL
jgi:hypothetical protein